ncbi:MAG: hypothetical protein JST00_34500 [Deltaproteobacteria bacterium]|nr:hypothetical protein [Deltaproteobacteria bacterium]
MTQVVTQLRLALSWVALFLATAACSCVPAASARDPQAQDRVCALILEMENRYRSARLYSDVGSVTVRMFEESMSPIGSTRAIFETNFDRASASFLFEYMTTVGDATQVAIWRQNGGPTRAWSSTNEHVREEPTLASALQSFAGMSNGTSRLVPSILGGLGSEFRGLPLRFDGEELVADERCFRLSASGSHAVIIWISERDYTIRKLFDRVHLQATPEDIRFAKKLAPPGFSEEALRELAQRRSSPFVVETTTEYLPVIDRPIRPSRFAFTVPRQDGTGLSK